MQLHVYIICRRHFHCWCLSVEIDILAEMWLGFLQHLLLSLKHVQSGMTNIKVSLKTEQGTGQTLDLKCYTIYSLTGKLMIRTSNITMTS